MVSGDNPIYLRAKQVAAKLGISRSTLYQWTKTLNGFPQPLKVGPRVVLFDVNMIEKFLQQR